MPLSSTHFKELAERPSCLLQLVFISQILWTRHRRVWPLALIHKMQQFCCLAIKYEINIIFFILPPAFGRKQGEVVMSDDW